MGGVVARVLLPIAIGSIGWALEKLFKDPPRRSLDLAPKPAPENHPGPAAPPPSIPEVPPPSIPQETPEVLIERARKELGIDCINHYNFAVSGQSGVGKSSFINGIRCVPDSHPNFAAPVGETECTQVVKRYPHPKAAHVVFWDFPGAGTKAHPAATYFSDKKLYAFDAILILTSDRFLEVDFQIVKGALQYNRPCAFVRTKCDVGVNSIMNAANGLHAVEASKKLRNDVENSFRSSLNHAGLAGFANRIPLFFISNKAFTKRSAYWVYNDNDEDVDDSEKWDKTLTFMDERKILEFLMDSSKSRAQ